MKTAKGSSYTSLLDFEVMNVNMVVNIKLERNLLGDITPEMIATAIPFIAARIQSERKPGVTFEKELNRIELHRNQLRDAYLSLFESYLYVTQPQTRVSSASVATATAQQKVLTAMPDKMLRSFAELYLGDTAQQYLLPDEREQMIEATVAVMKVSE